MLRAQPYGVSEPEEFQRQVAELFSTFPEWDEVKQAIDLDLARDPDSFEFIGMYEGQAWRAVTLLTRPPTTLVFSVDDSEQRITLRGLLPI